MFVLAGEFIQYGSSSSQCTVVWYIQSCSLLNVSRAATCPSDHCDRFSESGRLRHDHPTASQATQHHHQHQRDGTQTELTIAELASHFNDIVNVHSQFTFSAAGFIIGETLPPSSVCSSPQEAHHKADRTRTTHYKPTISIKPNFSLKRSNLLSTGASLLAQTTSCEGDSDTH